MTIEEILAGESKNVEFKENLPEKNKIPSFTANRDRSASCSIRLLHSLTSQNILLFPFPSFVRSDLGSKPLNTVWMK